MGESPGKFGHHPDPLIDAEVEVDRLKAIIAELVAAGENALHVLTPVRPVMDGLDRTRMYLREAIAKAKATRP
jgi:hypothetical protein